MKLLRLLTLTLLVGCSEPHDLYRDPSKSTDRRVENLLSQMTLEEKLQQLNQMVMGKDQNVNNLTTDRENNPLSPMTGSFIYFNDKPEVANALQRRAIEESRLGIPVLLGHDVIHGYRTLFPMPLAQACSWNTDLVYQSSRVAARESYLSGLRWTFSPMLDVARDGRWGRVAESYGEDPYANSRFAEAVVKGYQGERLDDKYSIAACAKHFAGYAYSQGGRDYHPTDISDLSLWETVLPPYQAAVDAGVATIMSSFNDLNGTPTVASKGLLTKILRKRLGFKGFVVSDWRAIEQLLTQRFAADSLDAAVKAITAGNDMDMYDMLYCNYLPRAVKEGIIDEEIIDEAVRRVLTVKFNLGLFDNPYTEVIEAEKRYMLPEDRALAHTLAQESMVLLKNENSTLPISTDVKRILLVGAMSKDRLNMMGTWRSHAQASDVVTILDGLKSEFEGRATIEYLDGASIEKNREGLLKELTLRAPKADMVIVALGEKNSWSGENGSKASLSLPAPQQRLVEVAKGSGRPVVVLTSSGRPLVLTAIEKYADAIIQMWQPGLFGGSAVAELLSGKANPSGRLAITFPAHDGQTPIFYNHRANARSHWKFKQGGYADAPNEPLYDFGHGLSYSKVEYSPLTISKDLICEDESTKVSIKVTNISDRDMQHTILWFIDDPVASITQPLKKLAHFEKRAIKAGQSERFSFKIDPLRDLGFVDSKGNRHLEAGDFYIIVDDQRIKLTLE